MSRLKVVAHDLKRDAAEIENCIQDICNQYSLVLDDFPYLKNKVIRTGIDLANMELKLLYFKALHIRAKFNLALATRKKVDKAKYQRFLTSFEEKVGFLENSLKKGELYK